MPCITEQSTVDKIAEVFCGEGKRNKAETLRIVGYAPSTCVSGRNRAKIYENVRVKAAIASIDIANKAEHIADRAERQRFWTIAYQDESKTMSDRLRASELLGRSEADFVDTTINQTQEPAQLSEQDLATLKQMAVHATKLKLHRPA